MTGIGAVPVKVARVRDRGDTAEKVRFTSTTLPPYLRKAKSIEELLPWLYFKGISTGDFHAALAAIPDTRPQCRRAVRDHNRTAQGRLVGRVRPQTATCCWPTMTSLPNIGSTSEPPTRSKAPLPPHWQNQRLPQPQNWPCHGVQVDDVSPDQMAEARRRKPHARDHRRDCIQGRDQTTSKRSLITPSPTFGHRSSCFSVCSAWAANVVNPRRMSVTPAASQTRVFAGTGIMQKGPGSDGPRLRDHNRR